MAFASAQDCLNKICTNFAEGAVWHKQAALSALKGGFRGLKRWHKVEAKGDSCSLVEFEEYLMDNYRLDVVYDKSAINKAMDYRFEKANLKAHMQEWVDREREVIGLLEESIQYLSSQKYYTIYKMLCDYLAEVENEFLYIKILQENLEYNGYAPHHVKIVMMVLHKYFQHEYDGGRIDFAIE